MLSKIQGTIKYITLSCSFMWQFPEKSIEEYSNGTDGLEIQEMWAQHWKGYGGQKNINFTWRYSKSDSNLCIVLVHTLQTANSVKFKPFICTVCES